MTQLNTPYPATAYLTGFLRQHEARLGLEVCQADAALELFLRVFSRAGLVSVRDELVQTARSPTRHDREVGSRRISEARDGRTVMPRGWPKLGQPLARRGRRRVAPSIAS